MVPYIYLEHTADAEFIAYGNTIDEAFANAALATVNLMIDPARIKSEVSRDIELESDALDSLLYDWLSELLYYFDAEQLIFGRFEAHVEQEGATYRLRAKAQGESATQLEDLFLHIKAVTYHDLRFEKKNNIYEAQVLLDI